MPRLNYHTLCVRPAEASAGHAFAFAARLADKHQNRMKWVQYFSMIVVARRAVILFHNSGPSLKNAH